MQIKKLMIQGFRSFGSAQEISIINSLTTFIGLNSAGKTTAMEGLRKLFGIGSAEREIFQEDFHVAKGEDPLQVSERALSIEARIEFGEGAAIPIFFSQMVVDNPGGTPYMRLRLEATWKKSALLAAGEITIGIYSIKTSEGEQEDEHNKQPFPNHLRQLFQIIYVPAIRRPAEQIKYATGTILYRVLRNINWQEEFKEDFKNQMEGITTSFQDLPEVKVVQSSITDFWQRFHKDERYNESELNFGGSDVDAILKKLEVSFSPSGLHRPFGINELGEGYRSLFYLTLVCALLDIESKVTTDTEEIGALRPLLTILAIEEPENHIAPQLLGRVVKILSTIGTTNNAQVFISCHTPAIVKRIAPESIVHFRITPEYETSVSRIVLPEETDEAYKYVKEAIHNYPEIYFARLVVIGEGDSEEVLFNRLMSVRDVDFDDNIITFAPLGHRFVNHIWKLLKALHIPYVTLLDLDAEREGGGWGRIKYAFKQLLEVGFERSVILVKSGGGVIDDTTLNDLHKRPLTDLTQLKSWIDRLEKYDVFYSAPLDLDFLMLEYYPSDYKVAIPENGGPQIPNKTTNQTAFDNKVKLGVQATLKSENATGSLYTQDQKELMIWYNYHFLGRGKPVTHIKVLSDMENEDIEAAIPPVLDRIFKRIKELLQ